MSKIQDIAKELLPQRAEYINLTELVEECEKRNILTSRRTIHNYVKDGILPKPVYQGLEALFHKKFIIDEIAAVHILKTVFTVSYKDLKLISSNKRFNLQEIVVELYGIIKYIEQGSPGKRLIRPLLINMANEEFLQQVAHLYLEEMIIKNNPNKKKSEDFIKYAFEKIK